MNNRIEILAPAGSTESLEAAVRCGADAVYLGAKEFSARAAAANFSLDELRNAIRYCHARGVKVYLTVNTLMFDDELESALTLIRNAYVFGIDAVIVQDIGLASLLRKYLPELRLHGSTQMSVHTPSGAKALKEMGFSRVVLSRELSLGEIEEIAKSCDIELEVFVHGALCMSVSGQCYFSAMLGSRSGNRGMCAQPCRLPFKLQGGSDHALSLKDNSVIEYINELEKIGVTSAKIEGRMKRPEYVAAATSACRQKRDEGMLSDDTLRHLEGVFSRTGFTSGYVKGIRDGNMFGHRRKEDVTAGSEKLLREIRNTYKSELQRVKIDFQFTASANEYPTLTVTDGEHSATVTGDTLCEEAMKVALSSDRVSALLMKCGGTPYLTGNVTTHLGDNVSLPASSINEMRRQALSLLTAQREGADRSAPSITLPSFSTHSVNRRANSFRARFTDTDIPEEFKEAELVFAPLGTKAERLTELKNSGFSVAVEIPRGMFGSEKKLRIQLERAKSSGITHVLASNIGAVYMAKELGLTVHGGFGLNLTNTASLMWAQEYGIVDVELSFELTEEQISKLGGTIPRGIIAAGYLPLMLTRCCPGYTKKASCKSCDKKQILQDRLHKNFIFTCDGNCTEILNTVPLLIPDKIKDFSGIDFYNFRFSVENYVEKVENILSFSSKHQNFKDFTRGLYYRGVK